MFVPLWFTVPAILLGIYLAFLVIFSVFVICSVRGYCVALDQTDAWQRLIGVWHQRLGVWQRWRHPAFVETPIRDGRASGFERVCRTGEAGQSRTGLARQ